MKQIGKKWQFLLNFNEDWCFFGRALQRYRSKTSSHPSREATFISMWLHGMPMHGTTDSAVRNALTCQMAVGVAVVYCPSKWSRRNTRVIAFIISLLMWWKVLIVSSQFSYSVCSHNHYFRSPHLSILGACDKLHVTCLPGLHCLDMGGSISGLPLLTFLMRRSGLAANTIPWLLLGITTL